MARQQRNTTFTQESTRPITQVALYARVSTLNYQDPEMQLSEMREYAGRRGWQIVEEFGRIIAEPENRGKEDAGHIGASLVQFGEALDHGISAERLGDGISGDISEYWEHLFDVETGYPKEEIQNEFEVVNLDLLIIDNVAIYPEFRGLGIAESAIHRTIDIFGTGCGLVACKPWPLQFTPSVADDQEALKRLAFPNVSKGEALRKLRSYWSRLGFWPLSNTGIYLLSASQRA